MIFTKYIFSRQLQKREKTNKIKKILVLNQLNYADSFNYN